MIEIKPTVSIVKGIKCIHEGDYYGSEIICDFFVQRRYCSLFMKYISDDIKCIECAELYDEAEEKEERGNKRRLLKQAEKDKIHSTGTERRTLSDHPELNHILDLHQEYLDDYSGGKGARLYHTVLEGVDLRKVNLRSASINEVNFEGADLSGASLYDVWMPKTNFEGAILKNANLGKTNISSCNMRKANLRGANLHRAHMAYTDFRDADLEGADFSNTTPWEANFTGANVKGATFKGADLRGVIGLKLEDTIDDYE